MKLRRSVRIASALLAVSVTAACSSSGSGKTTSSAPASGQPSITAPVDQPTGAPIVIGAICSCTGPESAAIGSSNRVATVWADYVNDHGGVNGHPVKLIVEDDQTNPATALRVAKELVEQDKVIAIVSDTSFVSSAYQAYLTSKGVPVVGGAPGGGGFLSDPNYFATGGSLAVTAFAAAELAKQDGHKVLGMMYCSELPVCKQYDTLLKAITSIVGIGYQSLAISATQNYTAPCLKMKSSGVDAMIVAESGALGARVWSACDHLGFKPGAYGEVTQAGPDYLTTPVLDGAKLSSAVALWNDTSYSDVATFQAAVDKYDASLKSSPLWEPFSLYSWLAGRLFEAVAKQANLSPTSTSADVRTGLYALKAVTVAGLTPPITYAAGKPSYIPCYFTVTVSGGKFVAGDGGKYTCLSSSDQKQLGAVLAHLG